MDNFNQSAIPFEIGGKIYMVDKIICHIKNNMSGGTIKIGIVNCSVTTYEIEKQKKIIQQTAIQIYNCRQ